MSSDIVSSLQLDTKFESCRVVVAKEINGCDSSFLISCVLSNCIKNKNALLLVSTHHSFQHYQSVGLKMNYNLQSHLQSGLIHFYDLGRDNMNVVLENEESSLEKNILEVKEKILLMKKNHDSVNVILDGISHLFDLHYTIREVNMFCKDIIALVRNYSNSFVFCHCNVASEDDVTHVIANLLAHAAHTVLEVENLASGWSADVSGHLTIKYPGQKFEEEHLYTMDMKQSRYLFKLFDRGVKLFAPGTV